MARHLHSLGTLTISNGTSASPQWLAATKGSAQSLFGSITSLVIFSPVGLLELVNVQVAPNDSPVAADWKNLQWQPGTDVVIQAGVAVNIPLTAGFRAMRLVTGSGANGWSLTSTPAAGTQATVTRAAASGATHVCTSFGFGFSATTALAGITTVTVNLRDGATGAGTILWSADYTLPAAVVPPFGYTAQVPLGGLSGTPGNAMTLEFSAGVGNLLEWVSLIGFDSGGAGGNVAADRVFTLIAQVDADYAS